MKEGLKKVAVLCILKQEDQMLLLKRKNEPNKGCYTPVGGKLEPYENPYQTAIRETFEETGIQIPAFKYVGLLVESAPTKYNWVNFVYLAEIDFIPAPPCDEGELEWIPFSEVLNVPTPKTDWFIYQYILENKPFVFNADYDKNLNLLRMQDELTGKEVYTNN